MTEELDKLINARVGQITITLGMIQAVPARAAQLRKAAAALVAVANGDIAAMGSDVRLEIVDDQVEINRQRKIKENAPTAGAAKNPLSVTDNASSMAITTFTVYPAGKDNTALIEDDGTKEVGIVSSEPIKFEGKEGYILIRPNVHGTREDGQPIRQATIIFKGDSLEELFIDGEVVFVPDFNKGRGDYREVFSSATQELGVKEEFFKYSNATAPNFLEELREHIKNELNKAKAASQAPEATVKGGTLTVTSMTVQGRSNNLVLEQNGPAR